MRGDTDESAGRPTRFAFGNFPDSHRPEDGVTVARLMLLTPWFPVPEAPYAGIFVAQQAEALALAGHQVSVVHLDALAWGGTDSATESRCRRLIAQLPVVPYGDERPDSAIEHIRLPFLSPSSSGFGTRAEWARKQLDSYFGPGGVADRFDLIHSHVTIPAGFAAIRRDLPVVNTEHFTGIQRVLSQEQARMAFLEVAREAHMVTVSRFLRDHLSQLLPNSSLEIDVVPNLVDFDGLDYRRRTEVGHRWVFVGSLNPRKNVDRLLRIFALVAHRGSDARLAIVGQGEMEDELDRLVHQLGIVDRVDFHGSLGRSATVERIRDSDLMVHLSSLETFGLVAVEAIAAGVPVISFANGGAEEAWGPIEEMAGMILPIHLQDAEVADRIMELCRSSDQLDLETAAGWVRERYSAERVASELSRIYDEVLA